MEKEFQKFIAGKQILVADPASASRATLAGILVSMGAKLPQIRLCQSFEEAEADIERFLPAMILTDYDLGKRCGLDLLQKHRAMQPHLKGSIFILVTGNTSQSAVAKAAEEDVDTFVIKPFTASTLRTALLRAVKLKTDPPEYIRTIEQGKKELALGKVDDAFKTFERSKKMDPAPALSCFYTGQVQDMKKALDLAASDYDQGLEFNKIHYKCLVGLYENCMGRKRHTEAYNIIKRISHYFPANPQRLTAVLRLAIMTQSYEDVERYYRIFTNIDERNEEMVRYVCAALVVCGKYYLNQNLGSRAVELFQKAAITASGRTKILREIIGALIDSDLTKQAEEFLAKFPPESQSGVDYQAMSLLLLNQSSSRSRVIETGRGLLAKNLHDPVIYKVLIHRSAEAGLQDAADDLMKAAIQRYPDLKITFEEARAAVTANPSPTKQ